MDDLSMLRARLTWSGVVYQLYCVLVHILDRRLTRVLYHGIKRGYNQRSDSGCFRTGDFPASVHCWMPARQQLVMQPGFIAAAGAGPRYRHKDR